MVVLVFVILVEVVIVDVDVAVDFSALLCRYY